MPAFCFMCGTALPIQSRFCRACGADLYPDGVGKNDHGAPRVEESNRGPLVVGFPAAASRSPTPPPPIVRPEDPPSSQIPPSNETAPAEPVAGSLGHRLLAFVIDVIVSLLIYTFFCFIAALAGGNATGVLPNPGYWLLGLVFYMTCASTLVHTTLGKAIFDLEVVSTRPNRRHPGPFLVFLRETLGRFICQFFFGAGYWTALGNPSRQSLGDKLARTRVIVRKRLTRQQKTGWGFALASGVLLLSCTSMILSGSAGTSKEGPRQSSASGESVGNAPQKYGLSDKLPAVLTIIMSRGGKDVSQGSGFLINGEGDAVTNVHVLREGDHGRAELGDGRTFGIASSMHSTRTTILQFFG